MDGLRGFKRGGHCSGKDNIPPASLTHTHTTSEGARSDVLAGMCVDVCMAWLYSSSRSAIIMVV